MMSNQDYRENDLPSTPPVPQTYVQPTQNRHNWGSYFIGLVSGIVIASTIGGGLVVYRYVATRQSPATTSASKPSAPIASTTPPAPPTLSTPTLSPPSPLSPSSPPPSQPAPPAAPSAPTTTYQTQGTLDKTSFTVRVLELRRVSGDALLLRMEMTNTGDAPISPAYDFTRENTWDFNVGAISGVYVVDTAEQRKYQVLSDEKDKAIASVIEPALRPGESREVFAQFPAPPATTRQMTVYFPKTSSPIFDVPIAQ